LFEAKRHLGFLSKSNSMVQCYTNNGVG
jgi:hypothetical protein